MRLIPDFFAMNSTAHTVMQLDMTLGNTYASKDTCFGYVPDSNGLNNVLNDKFLNGLVLGHTWGTARVSNWLHMVTNLFGTPIVSSSFFYHLGVKTQKSSTTFNTFILACLFIMCSDGPKFCEFIGKANIYFIYLGLTLATNIVIGIS